jgi:hypothetical protein
MDYNSIVSTHISLGHPKNPTFELCYDELEHLSSQNHEFVDPLV